MNCATTNYNERSWAIDLIGHLKQLAIRHNRSIQDAGGEQTISAEGGSLFPDVLLFGDRATARILQGWELKMPDTGIDDPEFRENAERKKNDHRHAITPYGHARCPWYFHRQPIQYPQRNCRNDPALRTARTTRAGRSCRTGLLWLQGELMLIHLHVQREPEGK